MAYTTVTVRQVDKSRAAVDISGSGVPLIQDREIPIGTDPAVWAFNVLAELNAKDTIATGKPLSSGQVITPAARVPSALETWHTGEARLKVLQARVDLGFTDAVAERDTLLASLKSSYKTVNP